MKYDELTEFQQEQARARFGATPLIGRDLHYYEYEVSADGNILSRRAVKMDIKKDTGEPILATCVPVENNEPQTVRAIRVIAMPVEDSTPKVEKKGGRFRKRIEKAIERQRKFEEQKTASIEEEQGDGQDA